MRPLTAILLVLLGATVFGAWFFSTHDRVTEREWQGYRGEARFNPWFAAGRLLEEAGYESESLATWSGNEALTGRYDTLVSRLSPDLTAGSRRARTFDWLAAGGHLVLLPPQGDADAGSVAVLRELGFELVPVPRDRAPDEDVAGADAAQEEAFDYALDLDSMDLRLEFGDDVPVTAVLSDKKGAIAVRRDWGEGVVTLFASDGWLSNWGLEDEDHARLMLDALAGWVDPGKVWFVYEAGVPPLWQLIWRNFPLLVACLALALLTWIAAVAPPFGPAVAGEMQERRSLLEHVRAAGVFAWRHDGAAMLHRSAIDATLLAAEARHPGIGRLSRADQARRLARLTGLPAERILHVLTESGGRRPREFTEDIRFLQLLREHL